MHITLDLLAIQTVSRYHDIVCNSLSVMQMAVRHQSKHEIFVAFNHIVVNSVLPQKQFYICNAPDSIFLLSLDEFNFPNDAFSNSELPVYYLLKFENLKQYTKAEIWLYIHSYIKTHLHRFTQSVITVPIGLIRMHPTVQIESNPELLLLAINALHINAEPVDEIANCQKRKVLCV